MVKVTTVAPLANYLLKRTSPLVMSLPVWQFLVQQAAETANATVEQIVKDATNANAEDVKNGTAAAKPKSTPEGMMVAYASIVSMALLPIIVGSFKSVKAHQNQKTKSQVCHR